MVIAKDQKALSLLTRHFHERRVEKRYSALLCGRVSTDELMIEARIGRDEEAWPKWQAQEDGKTARTHVRVDERRNNETLVELNPLTGRTNQLRIHCAYVGHPIVGDEWYGGANFAGASRLCLHAAELAFHHPDGGRWMEFRAPTSFSS
jgi:23S rRNA-/tRNA-specific pseudouridylate synthase